ncbi:MAG TPA: BatA domain-containing protein [Thermoanaerobaculia bacterium]|nr:BatA domain-containing protein [Thermoanaerobaculia bacterium]
MGIAFLTPLFLAALGLLAVPVLVHLRRRHRSRVLEFPSLMFLRQIQQSSMRRRRIRHWALLALRSLALAGLVLAFARPLLRDEAIAADLGVVGSELVVLLDNSFSMGFEDRFARAVGAARDRISRMGPEDRATLIVFSDRAAVAAESTGDAEALGVILGEVETVPRGTRFTLALKLARKAVLDSRLPSREVVLITDFQRVGWDRGEDLRLPPGTEVSFVDVSSRGGVPPANLAVAGVVLERSQEGERERVVASARVTRRGGEGEARATLALEIGGREIARQEVRLEPDASTLVGFEAFSLPPGTSRGRLVLDGDALGADNSLFFVLSRAQKLPVLLIEEPRSSGARSGFYLEQALSLSREPVIEVLRKSPAALGSADLARAAIVVASDVALETEAARRLRDFVEGGGGLLVALGSKSEGTHGALAAAGLVPAPEGGESGEPGSRIARIASVDRGHPGLEPFAAPRSGDFGTARFFRYRKVGGAEGDRVLVRFDDGAAALVERRVGEGRVLIWTSTFDTYWNDFALQPVFLPFVHQAIKSLAGFRPPAPWHIVGTVVDLAASPGMVEGGGGEVTARSPSGRELAVNDLLELDEQGFYTLHRGGEEAGVLAANVDVRESDLATVDAEELVAALRPPGGEQASGDRRAAVEATPVEREAAQGLWRYLVLAVLLLLVAEVFVANRLSEARS